MRTRIFIIMFLGLFFMLAKATPQIRKNSAPVVSYHEVDDPIPTCESKFLRSMEFSHDILSLMLSMCDIANVPVNNVNYTECQTLSIDTFNAMVQTNLAAQYRCLGIEP